MTFDLERVLESKRALRQKLARLPVAEKLKMLDALREQALVLRAAGEQYKAKMMRESPSEYRVKPRKD